MADGALMIEIEDTLAARVTAAADAAGVPVSVFVREALSNHLSMTADPGPDAGWEIDAAIADEAIRTGDLVPVEAVTAWMGSWFTADELPEPRPTPR